MGKSIIFFLLTFPVIVIAQTEIKTGFRKQHVRIGEPVELYLCFKHSPEQAVLFPDSSWNYHPFEYVSKKYFPTITQNGISKDCTVYILKTFEPIERLTISLPAFILKGSDSLTMFSKPASIKLNSLVPKLSSFPELKEDIHFHSIPDKTNYPLITLILLLIGLVTLVVLKFAGKPLVKKYNILSNKQSYRSFTYSFNQLEGEYLKNKEVFLLEKLLGLWKNYLSKIENKPLSTYTSTEIINIYGKEDLKDSLQVLDKAIFGGFYSGKEESAIKNLKNFTRKRYITRTNEIRNNY